MDFRRHIAISNFMNIRPVETDILSRRVKGQNDGRRNMVNLRYLSAFCERASKN